MNIEQYLKNYKQKLIKHKKVPIVILTIMFLIMMWANAGEKKTWESEATCDAYNGWLFTNEEACWEAGCHIEIDNLIVTCVPCVKTGAYSLEEAAGCCSQRSGGEEGLWVQFWSMNKNVYECKASPTTSQCNSKEETIANFVDEIWKGNDLHCKTKYYLLMFGGGFALVMVVLAML